MTMRSEQAARIAVEGFKLVDDAVSDFIEQEIDRRRADPASRPIYTYPSNGRRRLVDKPLDRAVSST